MALQQINRGQLAKGQNIVYFEGDMVPSIWVGRIEEVKNSEITIRYPDEQEMVTDEFHRKYYLQRVAHSGVVYTWPDDLCRLHFKKAPRPGYFHTILLK